MKVISILIVFLLTFWCFAHAEHFNFRTISDTKISDLNFSSCIDLDSSKLSELSVSIFGKTPSRLSDNCTSGVVFIPDYYPFLTAFADENEMSFVRILNANIIADSKYFYVSQVINIEYDNYKMCSYNTCSSEVFFFMYTHEIR